MHLPIHIPFIYFSTVNRAVREDPYFNLLLLLLLLFSVYICPLFQARHVTCPVLVDDEE